MSQRLNVSPENFKIAVDYTVDVEDRCQQRLQLKAPIGGARSQ